MILVLGKSALSVPDTRFSRVSGSTLVIIHGVCRLRKGKIKTTKKYIYGRKSLKWSEFMTNICRWILKKDVYFSFSIDWCLLVLSINSLIFDTFLKLYLIWSFCMLSIYLYWISRRTQWGKHYFFAVHAIFTTMTLWIQDFLKALIWRKVN